MSILFRGSWSRPRGLVTLVLALGVLAHGYAAESDPAFATLAAQVRDLPAATPAARRKQAALTQALTQVEAFRQASATAEANALLADITQALPHDIGRERQDPAQLRFLPPLAVTEGNPHLAALAGWAKDQLAKPDIPWRAATPTFNPFIGLGKDYGTRDEAIKTGTLFWLVAHPQSPYRDDPELLVRMLRRANAYADTYVMYAKTYGDNLNDFFAIGPACYAWYAIDQLWPDLILPSQRASWNRAVRQCADFWLKVHRETRKGPYRMGHYANRDLGVANILLNAGMWLTDQDCLAAAQELVAAQAQNFYPDGGFAYIGTQNESSGYHDADVVFLARYFLVSGEATIRDLLVRSQWYGPLSVEPPLVAEFWTAPSWKHTWNGSLSTGTEIVAGLSGNPYLRTLLDTQAARRKEGGSLDPLAATFYRRDVAPRPLPDAYTVIDRNIQGPRARYGRFSYAITTRVPDAAEPGLTTLVGAMTLGQDLKRNYPLNAALMGVKPKVRAPIGDKKKLDWAWLTRASRPAVILGREVAAVSADYALHAWGSSTKGPDVPWAANQEWLCIRDRMVGLLSIAPQGTQTATEVTLNLTLGTGGTAGGPPQQMQVVDLQTYRFGDLVVQVHGTNFASHASEEIKIRTSTGAEIVFRDGRGGGDQLKDYPADHPYHGLVEIRPAWQTAPLTATRLTQGELVGIQVQTGDATWILWHNRGANSATVPLTLPAGVASSLHRPGQVPQAPAPAQVELAADARILVVSSTQAADHAPGWENYEAMLQAGQVAAWPPQ